MKARLPKLTLSAFRTTLLDSQRFWSQFSNKADQKTMLSVSKLSYLCKLVDTTVHPLINWILFTTKAYARAKVTFTAKFGCTGEVANAHLQAILPSATAHL